MPQVGYPLCYLSASWAHFPDQFPAVDQTPEQRINELETQLREQKRLAANALKQAQELSLLLRTRLEVVEKDHGICLPKKSCQQFYHHHPLAPPLPLPPQPGQGRTEAYGPQATLGE